jgi:hypothetical protein
MPDLTLVTTTTATAEGYISNQKEGETNGDGFQQATG